MESPLPLLYDAAGSPLTFRQSIDLKRLDRIIARELKGGDVVYSPYSQSAVVYSCITQISNAFAQVPWGIWRRVRGVRDSGRARRNMPFIQDLSSPLAEYIQYPPPWDDEFRLKETLATLLLSGGNVWMYVDEPRSDGLPRALFVFGTRHVRPLRDRPFSELKGWVVNAGGRGVVLGPDDLIHWRLPNDMDDVLGLSPIEAVRVQIDADYAESIFESYFYRQAAAPSCLLTHKLGPLTREQRQDIREAFRDAFAGPRNAGSIVVLGSDYDLKQLGFPQSQTQFYESRTLNREEIAAAFFGFPVVLLNSEKSSGLNRSEIEMARLLLYENCVIPLCQRFTPPFNSRFVRKLDPEARLYFDPDVVPVVLKADLKVKSQIFSALWQCGIPTDDLIELLDINIPPGNDGKNTLRKTEDALSAALTVRAAAKIRRLAYEMRCATMNGNTTGETTIKRKWVRSLLPVILLASSVSDEEAATIDIEHGLVSLQARVDEIDCDLPPHVEKTMDLALSMFDDMTRLLSKDPKRASDVIRKTAHEMAARIVRSARDDICHTDGVLYNDVMNGRFRWR